MCNGGALVVVRSTSANGTRKKVVDDQSVIYKTVDHPSRPTRLTVSDPPARVEDQLAAAEALVRKMEECIAKAKELLDTSKELVEVSKALHESDEAAHAGRD